jgi:hypothetical protein
LEVRLKITQHFSTHYEAESWTTAWAIRSFGSAKSTAKAKLARVHSAADFGL